MKIYLAVPESPTKDMFVTPSALKRLENMGELTNNTTDKYLSTEEIAKYADEYDVFVTLWGMPTVRGDVVENRKLKLVCHLAGTVATHVDEKIFDTDVKVINGDSAFPDTLAECTLSLMLVALRKWHIIINKTKTGEAMWSEQLGDLAYTNSLFGKKIGLVGYGKIANRLIELIKPFGNEIMVADDYISKEEADHMGIRIVDLGTLAKESDVVSFHHTLTDKTYHLFGEAQINMLKPSAILVNTARGAVIDEQALIKRLQKGELFAALDVFEEEPLPLSSPLRAMENTIITPHVGGKTIEGVEAMVDVALTGLENFIAGKPINPITKEAYRRMTLG